MTTDAGSCVDQWGGGTVWQDAEHWDRDRAGELKHTHENGPKGYLTSSGTERN